MTMPITPTAHAELDYPEPSDYMAPDLAGPRARTIAAIHAYADWLAAHPEVPAPDQLEGTVFQHGVERQASIETVRAFMRGNGATPHTSGETGWAVLVLPDMPIKVQHTVFTAGEATVKSENWL